MSLNVEVLESIKVVFLHMQHKNKQNQTYYHISLEQLCKWLDMKYDDSNAFRNTFKQRIFKSETYGFMEASHELDPEGDYIIRKEGRKLIPYFSNNGFKAFCQISNSPKSYYVRKYFIRLETEYLDLLKADAEKIKAERESLMSKFSVYENQMKLLESSIQEDKHLIDNKSTVITELSIKLEDVKYKLDEANQTIINYIAPNQEIDMNLLQKYEKKYGIRKNIYLLPDTNFPMKYEMEFDSLYIFNNYVEYPELTQPNIYMLITDKTFNKDFICDIYFFSVEHYEHFTKLINSYLITENVYYTSLYEVFNSKGNCP